MSNFSNYQFGAPEAAPQSSLQSAQANAAEDTSGVRVNTGGNYSATFASDGSAQVSHNDVARFNMSDIPNGEEGLLATANRGGTPKSASQLRPDDMIRVGGMEVSVRVAERLGLIDRNESGRLVNASPERIKEATGEAEAERQRATQEQQKAAQVQQAVENRFPDEAAEASFAAIQSATQGTVTRALSRVAATGQLDSGLLGTLASEAHIEPSVMGQYLSKAMEGFTAQAKAFTQDQGLPSHLFDKFGEWAQANHPSESSKAIMDHIQQRSPKAYGKLVDSYIENLADIAPEEVIGRVTLANGTKPYRGANGKVMLRFGDTEMEWKAAIRAGRFKLTK